MNPTTVDARREASRKWVEPQAPGSLINPTIVQASGGERYRLLIPINANEDSRWGIAYALQLHRDGQPIDVCLLNIGEPITRWEVLRFRTQAEIDRFQSERAQSFADEAARPLLEQNISCRGFFRQGPVVQSILDVAAELACDEIVMPRPHSGISRLFTREIVGTVMCKARDIPVVLVGRTGTR